MLGDAVKVTPIFTYLEEKTSVNTYFPGSDKDDWCYIEPTATPNCFKGGFMSTFEKVTIKDYFAFITPG